MIHPQFKVFVQRDLAEMFETVRKGTLDDDSCHMLETIFWLCRVLTILIDPSDPKYPEAIQATHELVGKLSTVDPLQ